MSGKFFFFFSAAESSGQEMITDFWGQFVGALDSINPPELVMISDKKTKR